MKKAAKNRHFEENEMKNLTRKRGFDIILRNKFVTVVNKFA